jgi:hypothetical protein
MTGFPANRCSEEGYWQEANRRRSPTSRIPRTGEFTCGWPRKWGPIRGWQSAGVGFEAIIAFGLVVLSATR